MNKFFIPKRPLLAGHAISSQLHPIIQIKFEGVLYIVNTGHLFI